MLAGSQGGLQTNAMEGPDQSEEPAYLLLQASNKQANSHAAAAAAAAAQSAAQIHVSLEQWQLIRRSLSNSISGETPHHLLNADAQQIWVKTRPVTSLP